MKICMVTTSEIFHDSRILNEAETLSEKYQVTILARKYPGQEITSPEQSRRAKYPFKIKVVGYRPTPFFQLSIFSSFFSLAKAAFREKPDIYHAHDLDGFLCAFGAALIKRKILIYDSHELWSDTFPFANLKGIQWLLPILERALIWRVNKGITVNDSLSEILSKKYHKHFLSLYNTLKISSSKKTFFSLKKRFPNKKIILHLGAADEGRGMEQIIKAAKYFDKNMILVFLGGGKIEEQSRNLVVMNNLKDRIFLLPAVMPNEIISTIKQADLGLALTQPISKSYYYSLPNKIFQYIAAELPILGSDLPEFKKIILKNQIGEVVNPSKPKLIAQKIIMMVKKTAQKKYRQNLVGLAKEKYNWSIESKKIIKFYQQLKK